MLQSNQNGGTKSGTVRLLPAFDEYLLGWKDRDVVVAAEHRAKINRGGGWLHPVLLVDGQLVATWSTRRSSKQTTIELSPFVPLTAAMRSGAAEEAKDIAAFLGVLVELGA